jgi:hypothetical protein
LQRPGEAAAAGEQSGVILPAVAMHVLMPELTAHAQLDFIPVSPR